MAEFVVAILGMGTGVFTVSVFGKLRSVSAYRAYRSGLQSTRLVKDSLLNRTAVMLVVVEAVTGCGLASAAALQVAGAAAGHAWSEAALALAAALTLVLSAGVLASLRRGARTPCACFGGNSVRPLGAAHVIRNISLLALLAAGLAVSELQRDRPGAAGAILAVPAGLILSLFIIRWDDIAALIDSGSGSVEHRG